MLWRQELAAREHMFDHGQLGPPTPSSVGALTLVDSRRPFTNDVKHRRPSMPDQLESDPSKPLMTRRGSSGGSFSEKKARPLALDELAGFGCGMSDSLPMPALDAEKDHELEKKPDPPSVNGVVYPKSISAQLAALRTAGVPKNTTPSPTLVSVPPILADKRCSGYFVEAVCPYDPMFYFPRLMVLDEMDGTVLGERRNGRKDYLPKQKVRREAGEF
jgi:hypothetical protein